MSLHSSSIPEGHSQLTNRLTYLAQRARESGSSRCLCPRSPVHSREHAALPQPVGQYRGFCGAAAWRLCTASGCGARSGTPASQYAQRRCFPHSTVPSPRNCEGVRVSIICSGSSTALPFTASDAGGFRHRRCCRRGRRSTGSPRSAVAPAPCFGRGCPHTMHNHRYHPNPHHDSRQSWRCCPLKLWPTMQSSDC